MIEDQLQQHQVEDQTHQVNKKRKTDPRDTEFVIKYDKKNFSGRQADEESSGTAELY